MARSPRSWPVRALLCNPTADEIRHVWDEVLPAAYRPELQMFALFETDGARDAVQETFSGTDIGMRLCCTTGSLPDFFARTRLFWSFALVTLKETTTPQALRALFDHALDGAVTLARVEFGLARWACLLRDWPLTLRAGAMTHALLVRQGDPGPAPPHPDEGSFLTWRRHGDIVPTPAVEAQEARILNGRRWPRAQRPVARPHTTANGGPWSPTLPDGRPWPRISVVTPSWNQGRFIEETILSVLNQGYPDLEYIVIDGGSTDETADILARYRDRLSVCISEPDRGQSDAINKGMARATGEILTWLNSDDMLAEGALAAVAMAFATSQADMVSGICVQQREGRPTGRHMAACPDGPLPLVDLLDLDTGWLAGEFFFQPEVFFRRSLWEKAGGHVREDLFYSMDYELWVRFAKAGAVLHTVGRPLALYRTHADQKTFDPERFKPELSTVAQGYLERLGLSVRPNRPPVDYGRSLRFALVNDVGPSFGAGLVMARMADAIRRAGHQAVLRGFSEGELPVKAAPGAEAAMLGWLEEYEPDCVLLGNLHFAEIDLGFVETVAARFPTIWVANDVWPVTGRCAYTGGCTKYYGTCDEACPSPDIYPALAPERIAAAHRRKRALFQAPSPPVLLTYSRWMTEFLRSGIPAAPAAAGPRIEEFRLGLDTERFSPLDRPSCRRLLRLPQDRFIVLFSASNVADPRKGFAHLFEALRGMQDIRPLLLAVGNQPPAEMTLGLDLRATGYVPSRDHLSLIYSAADVFVGPSLEEAFGQVFIEAPACGTPAIGYPLGGVTDAIRDGVTGLLAPGVGAAHLASCLRRLHDDPDFHRSLREWGRLHVENTWSLEASFRQFFGVLQRLRWVESFGMPHRIHMPPLPA